MDSNSLQKIMADNALDGSTHKQKVSLLEDEMRKHEQLSIQTNHYFAHGTYTREVILPKGALISGKIHRYSCVNILSKGSLCLVTDEGRYDIEAPNTFVSGPGVQKAIYVLEDSVMLNVHPWDGKKDLKQIEEYVIIPSLEQYELESGEVL